jgi:ribosomal 30S subunit maturation factor RimM
MSASSAKAIQYDMEVYSSDAAPLGRVKQIHEDDILIDRKHARDVLVPLSVVGEVLLEEKRVELALTEAEFNDRDWQHPPLL